MILKANETEILKLQTTTRLRKFKIILRRWIFRANIDISDASCVKK